LCDLTRMLLHDMPLPAKLVEGVSREAAPTMKRGRGHFDDIPWALDASSTIRNPRPDELPELLRLATAATKLCLAQPSAIARVIAHDPASAWVIEKSGHVAGGCALLYLSPVGLAHLQDGGLDPYNPPLECLARPGERPAGIYFWVVFKTKALARGLTSIFDMLRRGRYSGADLWAAPYTIPGRRLAESLGFRPFPCPAGNLYRYVRKRNTPRKLEDNDGG
jgi:hypothetical protein